MYNAQIKEKFISSLFIEEENKNFASYKKGMTQIFDRATQFEDSLGKDILFFTKDEMIGFLEKYLNGGRTYHLGVFRKLKMYCNWGVNENIIPKNILETINIEDINISQSYQNTMIKDEEELINIFDENLKPLSEDTKDNIFRVIFLLIYAGIQFDDIWYLKNDDINLINKTIVCNSGIINLSDACVKTINYYLGMTDLTNNLRSTIALKPILREGYLLSYTRTAITKSEREKMKKSYTAAISHAFANFSKKLTPSSIFDSGVFYRMFLIEKETGKMDCTEYLFSRRNQILTIQKPKMVENQCIYEYNIWKKAFLL